MKGMIPLFKKRNPERIDRTIELLLQVWKQQPDTRFFQLAHNLKYEYATANGIEGNIEQLLNNSGRLVSIQNRRVIDLYNLEDEEFIKFLEAKLEESS
jgi:hypothetical protein